MKLSNEELINISGGAVTSTFINAAVKGITLLIELGKSLGSTIRRISEKKSCSI
ncbi:MAG: hypothetical protein IKJ43_03695 [Bacilli bacterium]|nr:hypothetical protein [Bacilli bacterium]